MRDEYVLSEQVMAKADEDNGPVGGLPVFGFFLVSYIDEDGDKARKWHLEGDPDIEETIAALELWKMRLLASSYDWDDRSA